MLASAIYSLTTLIECNQQPEVWTEGQSTVAEILQILGEWYVEEARALLCEVVKVPDVWNECEIDADW